MGANSASTASMSTDAAKSLSRQRAGAASKGAPFFFGYGPLGTENMNILTPGDSCLRCWKSKQAHAPLKSLKHEIYAR
jgi:hypothetical protein